MQNLYTRNNHKFINTTERFLIEGLIISDNFIIMVLPNFQLMLFNCPSMLYPEIKEHIILINQPGKLCLDFQNCYFSLQKSASNSKNLTDTFKEY